MAAGRRNRCRPVTDPTPIYKELLLDDAAFLAALQETLDQLGYPLREAQVDWMTYKGIKFHKLPIPGKDPGRAIVRVSAQTANSADLTEAAVTFLPIPFVFTGWKNISIFLESLTLTRAFFEINRKWKKGAMVFESSMCIPKDEIEDFKVMDKAARVEQVQTWFELMPLPLEQRTLAGSDRRWVVDRLAGLAANKPTPELSKLFFRDLSRGLGLPSVYEEKVSAVWTGDTRSDADTILKWAQELRVHPSKEGYTVVGSLLSVLYATYQDSELLGILRRGYLIPSEDIDRLRSA